MNAILFTVMALADMAALADISLPPRPWPPPPHDSICGVAFVVVGVVTVSLIIILQRLRRVRFGDSRRVKGQGE